MSAVLNISNHLSTIRKYIPAASDTIIYADELNTWATLGVCNLLKRHNDGVQRPWQGAGSSVLHVTLDNEDEVSRPLEKGLRLLLLLNTDVCEGLVQCLESQLQMSRSE